MARSLRSSPQLLHLDAAEPQSIVRWRSEMDRAFPPLAITPRDPAGFRAEYRAAGTDELQLSDLSANAHSVERRPGAVTEQNLDYYKMSLQVAGSGIMMQGNREIVLTPGTIAIYDTSRPYTLEFTDDYRFIVAMFPKSSLNLPSGLAGELTARAIGSDTGTGSVVAAFMTGLAGSLESLSSPSGSRLARTGLDLLSALLASEAGLDNVAASTTRRAQLATICMYINDHLSDPHLNPEAVARAHFVSVRHLYNLFADTGVTVAQWIRLRRFAEFRRDLADPLTSNQTITQLAAKFALSDAGYYSRVFRELYGVTPSEWRQSHQAA